MNVFPAISEKELREDGPWPQVLWDAHGRINVYLTFSEAHKVVPLPPDFVGPPEAGWVLFLQEDFKTKEEAILWYKEQ